VSFELLPGSVALTELEKFPRNATCGLLIWRENSISAEHKNVKLICSVFHKQIYYSRICLIRHHRGLEKSDRLGEVTIMQTGENFVIVTHLHT